MSKYIPQIERIERVIQLSQLGEKKGLGLKVLYNENIDYSGRTRHEGMLCMIIHTILQLIQVTLVAVVKKYLLEYRDLEICALVYRLGVTGT